MAHSMGREGESACWKGKINNEHVFVSKNSTKLIARMTSHYKPCIEVHGLVLCVDHFILSSNLITFVLVQPTCSKGMQPPSIILSQRKHNPCRSAML